jgi:hypothetical protein
MIEYTELENLEDLTREVQEVRGALETLDNVLGELVRWSQNLPERWSSTTWTTEGLDAALAAMTEAIAELKTPSAGLAGLLEQLSAIGNELTKARTVGEPASDIGAAGNLTAFTSTEGPKRRGHQDPEEDRERHEYAVERVIRQAYDVLILQAEEDGHDVRWVGLVELRAELDQDAAHSGRLPYGRAEVDAALHRLSWVPGIHVQAEANQQALTEEDWEAGVTFGGSTRHLLLIEDGR